MTKRGRPTQPRADAAIAKAQAYIRERKKVLAEYDPVEASRISRSYRKVQPTMTPKPPTLPVSNAQLEASLEKYFWLQVRKILGGIPVKIAPLEKGCPDRMVLLPGGRIKLVELKTERGTVSAAQKIWHSRALERTGNRVDVLTGRNGVDAWISLQANGGRES